MALIGFFRSLQNTQKSRKVKDSKPFSAMAEVEAKTAGQPVPPPDGHYAAGDVVEGEEKEATRGLRVAQRMLTAIQRYCVGDVAGEEEPQPRLGLGALVRVQRVLRESHEYGDVALLVRLALPAVQAAGEGHGGRPQQEVEEEVQAADEEEEAVMVFKSHETLLQRRHVDAALRPATRYTLLSHNDVYAKL